MPARHAGFWVRGHSRHLVAVAMIERKDRTAERRGGSGAWCGALGRSSSGRDRRTLRNSRSRREKNRARKLTTDEIGAHTCSNFYQGGQFPCLGASQNRIPRANCDDDSRRFLSIASNRPIDGVFVRKSSILAPLPDVKAATSVLFRTAECWVDLPSPSSSDFAPRAVRHRAVTPQGRLA